MMTEMQEREIAIYEAEQRCCDLADTILNLLVERQLSTFETLRVLKKVKKTIQSLIRSTNWNSSLVCEPSPNEASVFDPKEIVAEINRRKGTLNSPSE